MKTSELTGAALDWAVAKSAGELAEDGGQVHIVGSRVRFYEDTTDLPYAPSKDWAAGGPIIEKEKITLRHNSENNCWVAEWWADNSGMAKNPAQRFKPNCFMAGQMPLVAAMRCFVASRLGDKVEIPQELEEI